MNPGSVFGLTLWRGPSVRQAGDTELALQRQKIAEGAPPAYSSPSEQACTDRWDQLGERQRSAGDRDGFLAACSSIPAPGMPGYDEVVAEVAASSP
ncbi:hypothetical protein CP970_21325 [Streptomyces kanamyceticus]|uniref:Uncharacterized protein n=1 Tax=Streptomyces kanamyceticus TaxID=1967 RepID=A0A5J6GGY1_STRKN|nr:hypothetical protein CP970_21325 [Streptomyces kanamyceticus]